MLTRVKQETNLSKTSSLSASDTGNSAAVEWPAPARFLQAARDFLEECAMSSSSTLLVPDKDADGLTGGLIVYRTLVSLGHKPENIGVHFVSKGANPHQEPERGRLATYGAQYAVIVDQGSRSGPILVPKAKNLLLDHHYSEEFPEDTLVLSACKHEPVATSASLAYILCRPLHTSIPGTCDYLCAMGTLGDLGTSFRFPPPFPEKDMKECFKKYTKKTINAAASLINAPRRTATYDVESAWKMSALLHSTSPFDIVSPHPSTAQLSIPQRLRDARKETNQEVERCTHAAPKFSDDGKVALLKIESAAQVHPVVAARWAGHLKSPKLQIVMVANSGYTPGLTNFSCRVARCAHRSGEHDVDIISILKEYAARSPGLAEAMGGDFARGHRQASGGIVPAEQFEKLWSVMENSIPANNPKDKDNGEGSPRKKRKKKYVRKNTLENWVKRG